jgi:HK97 family phage portal protein
MGSPFRLLARSLEQKAVAGAENLTWEKIFGQPSSKSGVSVNLDSALKVSTVFACARVLANGISQIPLKLYREDEHGNKQLAKDHPLYRILWRRPNDFMTSFEMRQMMMFHAVLLGNAFAYIGRGGTDRRVVELIPLVPGRVTVNRYADYTVTYTVHSSDGQVSELPADNVLHIRGPMWDGVCGLDAIHIAREAIGLAIATEENHARLFSNGAQPGGVLGVAGLGAAAAKQLQIDWKEAQAGVANRFKTVVLPGEAKFTPFAMTGVDSQHLETRRFQIEQICTDLGVFPQMVGYSDKTSTFASAEAFFQAHVTHSLEPWIENWQQTLARDLFPDEDDITAEFSVQGLLRGDHATRAEFYAAGIINGYFTRNEVRGWENLNSLPGLDEPLIPLNMGTQSERDAMVSDVGKAVKSMIGHNGGPDLDDAAIEGVVRSAMVTFNQHRIGTGQP